MFKNIVEFEVGDRCESVHFPLHCSLNFQSDIDSTARNNERYKSNENFKRYK